MKVFPYILFVLSPFATLSQRAVDDPTRDGWDTEVLSQAAGKQVFSAYRHADTAGGIIGRSGRAT
jgi:hypothetical protein